MTDTNPNPEDPPPEHVSTEDFLKQVHSSADINKSGLIKEGIKLVALILLSAVLIVLAGWMLIAGLFWFFAGGTHR